MIRVPILSGLLGLACSVARCDAGQSADQFTYHPEKGFPKRFTPNIGNAVPKPMPFVLLGIGRWDILPSCVTGIAVGPSTLTRAKRWLENERSGKGSDFTLVDHLLTKENIITPHSISNPAKIGVVIRICFPVSTKLLLRSLDRYLPSHGHDLLMERIESALGRDTMLPIGEEISFYWMDNNDLCILHNGNHFDTLNMPYVNRSLLEIFVGPGPNIVSRELYRSVTERLPTIEDI